jgi:CubicO group peptidase (beta-lactamase class C family)
MAIRRSTWRVDRLMSDELAAASIPDAAIAITRGDQVLRVRGYGHDVDDVPITEDTLSAYRFAEQVLTSLAVLQLVDAGRVSLDDLPLMFDPSRM